MDDDEEMLVLALDEDEIYAVRRLADAIGVDVAMLGHVIIPKYATITHDNPRYKKF